jgi:hypothetical protein
MRDCYTDILELDVAWICIEGLGHQVCHIRGVLADFEFDEVACARPVGVLAVHEDLADDEASEELLEMEEELEHEESEDSRACPDRRIEGRRSLMC